MRKRGDLLLHLIEQRLPCLHPFDAIQRGREDVQCHDDRTGEDREAHQRFDQSISLITLCMRHWLFSAVMVTAPVSQFMRTMREEPRAAASWLDMAISDG